MITIKVQKKSKPDPKTTPPGKIFLTFISKNAWSFYPKIAKEMDWGVSYETLDNELQSIMTDAMVGKTFVDNLIKIKSLKGTNNK